MAKQRWSKETIIKPQIVKQIGGHLFRIIEQIHKNNPYGGLGPKFPFTYIDLTAGPGLHDGNLAGIAAVFHSMLMDSKFSWVMHLIEERAGDYRSLVEYFQVAHDPSPICASANLPLRHVEYHHGKSEDIAPHILGQLKIRPFGLICLDPWGCGTREERLIASIARCDQTLRMDWLLHLPTRTVKRVRNCRDTKFNLYLDQLIALTGKRRGFIKESPSGTKQDWVYIFLTDAGRPTISQWAREGWYEIASDRGRSVLLGANYTIDEIEEMSNQRLAFGEEDDYEEDEQPALFE